MFTSAVETDKKLNVNLNPSGPAWGLSNTGGRMVPSMLEHLDTQSVKTLLELKIIGFPILLLPVYLAWLMALYYFKYYSKSKSISGDIKKLIINLKYTAKNWSYILYKGKKEIPLPAKIMFFFWYLWLSSIIIPASKVGLATIKIKILNFYFTPFLLTIVTCILGILAKKKRKGIIFKINKKIPNYKKALYFIEIIVLITAIITIYWAHNNIS